jgi:AraC-like DNA-binding protein
MKPFAIAVCILGLTGFLSPVHQGQDMSVEELLNNLKTEHYSGRPIDLDLKKVGIETLFFHLEKSSGLSFELSSSISLKPLAHKNYNFKQVPWDQILAFVLKEFNLEATPKDGGVYIQPKEDALMRIIREDQLQASESSRIPLYLYFLAAFILAGGSGGFILYRRRLKAGRRSLRGFVIDPAKADEIMKRVTYLFDVEKIFRKTDISLRTLSEELSIPSYQLSWVINKKMDATFSGLVNSYRIEEVKKRLASPQDTEKTILDIAFDAGFNTKTSFNRVFKKMTGITPSQYRQRHCIQKNL